MYHSKLVWDLDEFRKVCMLGRPCPLKTPRFVGGFVSQTSFLELLPPAPHAFWLNLPSQLLIGYHLLIFFIFESGSQKSFSRANVVSSFVFVNINVIV